MGKLSSSEVDDQGNDSYNSYEAQSSNPWYDLDLDWNIEKIQPHQWYNQSIFYTDDFNQDPTDSVVGLEESSSEDSSSSPPSVQRIVIINNAGIPDDIKNEYMKQHLSQIAKLRSMIMGETGKLIQDSFRQYGSSGRDDSRTTTTSTTTTTTDTTTPSIRFRSL